MASDSNSNGGIGFVGMLTVVFIALKLTKFIEWSWWWVLSPVWITALVLISFIVFVGGVYFALEVRKK